MENEAPEAEARGEAQPTPPLNALALEFAGASDPGRVRLENEDRWAAYPEQGLFVLADGMGGEQAGGVASQAVVEMLPGLLDQEAPDLPHLPARDVRAALCRALVALNAQVYLKSRHEDGLAGMGSTVVAAVVLDAAIMLGHMGDSRAYLLRGDRLRLLTKDHCLTQVLVDAGELTLEEAKTHPARHLITRFVGMAIEPVPQMCLVPIETDDCLLLCSDGLTKEVDDSRIEAILREPRDPQTLCHDLLDAANLAGGRDNVTVLVLKFVESH